MKRIIGIIILVLVFALLIRMSCVAYGVTWALGFLFAIIILVAIFLIQGD